MSDVIIYTAATGEIERVPSLDEGHAGAVVIAEEVPADFEATPWTVIDGALVPDLAAARAEQRALINRARDAAQDGGADTPFGRFDSAPRSREFLNGAVTNALLSQLNELPFTIDWTRADNVVVTLSAAELIAAGVAVASWVDTVHQRAVILKGRIEAAETLAAIRAVVWSLEDPE